MAGEDLDAGLADLLARNYAFVPSHVAPIFDGDEALVWRVSGGGRDLVVHLGPPWRRMVELKWIHRLVRFVAQDIPEVVTPVATVTGGTFVPFEDSLVAVYPFVDGDSLDKEDEREIRAAGVLLARLHTSLLGFTGGGRPHPSTDAPQPRASSDEPADLSDPELDRWESEASEHPWATGVIHGDYYRRNLLCRDHEIAGVIDWHESRIAPLIAEVAFAAWEFGHDDDLNFVPETARRFVDAYRESGPLEPREYDGLMPWMRIALRDNIRYGLDAARLGAHSDGEYTRMQIAAFSALRGRSLNG